MNNHVSTLMAEGFVFLEGPRWHDGRLWVSDMWDFLVYKVAPDGSREVVCELPQRPSGLGFLPDGTPLVVSMGDKKLMKIVGHRLQEYADLSSLAVGDINDMVLDSDGRAYVGCFGYDLFGGAEKQPADILSVDADGVASVAARGLDFPNGILLADNGRSLIVAETWAGRLTKFDRAPDGTLSKRRIFAQLDGCTPDGICLDRAGAVWVSSFGSSEFLRVLEGGEITDRVFCEGKRAVACQLGGDDGRTLFCLTFAGDMEDIHQRKRAGAIETVTVAVGAAGSP
jgi:sugar lactone lactonase YvrE